MNIMFNLLTSIIVYFASAQQSVDQYPITTISDQPEATSQQVLASEEYSLDNRNQVENINEIFVDNILLAIRYMDGEIQKGQPIDWDKIRSPGQATFTLNPGESFAFHDNLVPEFKDSVVQTTNARFNSAEGFKYDGFIVGDGVCHLASFINEIATQAGLAVHAPVRHDFAPIPDIDRTFGTSINSNGTVQNLYVTNTSDKTIVFIFEHNSQSLKITVESV
jgi:hypothetical protein